MFYSETILAKKGPLANIWLAAHMDRKLNKTQISQTNIHGSIGDILNGKLPAMALRLSGQILLGVVKIYWRKARYLLEDCNETLSKAQLGTKRNNIDLPQESLNTSAAITMPISTADFDMLMNEPEFDFNLPELEIGASQHLLTNVTPKKPLRLKSFEGEGKFAAENEDWGFDDFELPLSAIKTSDIEVEQPRDALPDISFSPDKSNLSLQKDKSILDDNFEFNDVGLDDFAVPTTPQNIIEEHSAVISSSPAKKKARKATKNQLFDNETEISHTAYQAQLRDPSNTIRKAVNDSDSSKRSITEILALPNVDGITSELLTLFTEKRQKLEIEQPRERDLSLDNFDLHEFPDFGKEDENHSKVDMSTILEPLSPPAPVFSSPDRIIENNLIANQFRESLIKELEQKESVEFTSAVVGEKNKKKMALSFFEVLAMSGRGEVRASQEKPFAPISIVAC